MNKQLPSNREVEGTLLADWHQHPVRPRIHTNKGIVPRSLLESVPTDIISCYFPPRTVRTGDPEGTMLNVLGGTLMRGKRL